MWSFVRAAGTRTLDNMPHSHVILLVDDDQNDRFLLRRAFNKTGVINPVHEVGDGQAAITYLKGEGPYSDRNRFPFPKIIILDLKMPMMDGFQVLEWIRSTLPAQSLLIIVLSNVHEVRYLNRAYELGANSFISKPGNEQDLNGLVASFRDPWILQNNPGQPRLNSPLRLSTEFLP